MSDLCRERNFYSISNLEDQIPKDILLKIITDEYYSFEIREVMLNLFDSMYLDREPY